MAIHGHARHNVPRSPEYNIWLAMKDRCHNPRCKMYPYYGERGIAVCTEWRTDFEAFLRDVGRRPAPHLTIERLDNSRGYEPGNVAWVTRAQQVRNRRNNVHVVFEGKDWILTDLARKYGILPQVLRRRLTVSKLQIGEALKPGRPDTSGEKNAAAVLTADAVREIRRRISAGEFQYSIAASFGINKGTVSAIKNNKIWKSLR